MGQGARILACAGAPRGLVCGASSVSEGHLLGEAEFLTHLLFLFRSVGPDKLDVTGCFDRSCSGSCGLRKKAALLARTTSSAHHPVPSCQVSNCAATVDSGFEAPSLVEQASWSAEPSTA